MMSHERNRWIAKWYNIDTMPSVLVKNIPQELHRKLKERAADNRRSLNSELLVILEGAVADAAGPPPLEVVDRLRIAGNAPLTDAILDEARSSGRP
jgi:plasmid stability protein